MGNTEIGRMARQMCINDISTTARNCVDEIFLLFLKVAEVEMSGADITNMMLIPIMNVLDRTESAMKETRANFQKDVARYIEKEAVRAIVAKRDDVLPFHGEGGDG